MYDADLFWCCSSLYVTITDNGFFNDNDMC